MKVFSFKTYESAASKGGSPQVVKGKALNLKQLKQIKGGQGESHDLIPSSGVYSGGSEEPPSN